MKQQKKNKIHYNSNENVHYFQGKANNHSTKNKQQKPTQQIKVQVEKHKNSLCLSTNINRNNTSLNSNKNINSNNSSANTNNKNNCYFNANRNNNKSKDKYLSLTSNLNRSFDGHQQQSHDIKNNQNSRLSQGLKYQSVHQGNRLKSSNRRYQQKSFMLPQTQSIIQMIDLLTQYEKVCQQKMDLPKAQQARKKINQLKKEELTTRRKQLQQSEIQNVNKTNRQTKQQAKNFNAFWNEKIDQAIQTLKQLQKQHIQEQFQHLDYFMAQVKQQQIPRVKFSSKILQTRKNLSSLIKGRKYKEAEHLKHILQKLQKQEEQKWQISCQDKKRIKIKEFKKKQQIELYAFRLKLTSSFNQLVSQKQKQEIRMLKNIRKKQIQSAKVPNFLLRARTNLLNESKARLNQAQ